MAALRRGADTVVVAKTSALGAQVLHRELKERLTLSTLFRDFGRALPVETRAILLKSAGGGWVKDPSAAPLSKDEEGLLPLQAERVEQHSRRCSRPVTWRAGQDARARKEWGTRLRGRDESFNAICAGRSFYKRKVWTMLGSDLRW